MDYIRENAKKSRVFNKKFSVILQEDTVLLGYKISERGLRVVYVNPKETLQSVLSAVGNY